MLRAGLDVRAVAPGTSGPPGALVVRELGCVTTVPRPSALAR